MPTLAFAFSSDSKDAAVANPAPAPQTPPYSPTPRPSTPLSQSTIPVHRPIPGPQSPAPRPLPGNPGPNSGVPPPGPQPQAEGTITQEIEPSEISGLTGPSSENQVTAQEKAANTNRLGASLSATVGVTACAEGANTFRSNESLSGTLIDACLRNFASARKLKELEAQAAKNAGKETSPELDANSDALKSKGAQAILNDFEEKFGVSQEDFTKVLVSSKGDPNVLGEPDKLHDLLNGKLSREEIERAVNAARDLSPAEREALLSESRLAGLSEEFAYAIGKGGSAKGKFRSLRSSLIRSFQGSEGVASSVGSTSDAGRKPASVPGNNKFARLTPLEDPIFAQNSLSEPTEFTLFYIVHLKIMEKAPLLDHDGAAQKRAKP
ncbi:MAG TPA: hypothetical protein VIH99_03265 [Bdellovibrionota bacterium]